MKLRFRGNSLRLRVNQAEVQTLSTGGVLKEQVEFPGTTFLSYILKAGSGADPQVFFSEGEIRIAVPRLLITNWAVTEEIGLYFTLPTGGKPLKVSIEKDLECVDGPVEERDPNAFPRGLAEKVC